MKKLGDIPCADFSSLHNVIVDVVNKHAPNKTRVLRGNHKPHVSRSLRKAIMKRSRLKNRANKSNDSLDLHLYKKQRNYVVNLNKQAKRSFFSAVDSSSNSFWNLTKPLFSDKAG